MYVVTVINDNYLYASCVLLLGGGGGGGGIIAHNTHIVSCTLTSYLYTDSHCIMSVELIIYNRPHFLLQQILISYGLIEKW